MDVARLLAGICQTIYVLLTEVLRNDWKKSGTAFRSRILYKKNTIKSRDTTYPCSTGIVRPDAGGSSRLSQKADRQAKVKHLQNSKLLVGCLAKRTETGTHQRQSFTLVVMYLSGRFLLAIRMPFGVKLNSTSFFIVFRMMINMAGKKK